MSDSNPREAQVEIEFDRDQIDRAMMTVRGTVGDVERRREAQPWRAPTDAPSEETCSARNLRWDCPTVKDEYPLCAP